ncbi:hypothetical protein [Bacillus cereus group sp. BcHK140]|uniref:hypothetical protein n=1 Tax=Bacillus cereus group sp. BcHK140 TaxID=3018092 RepID=UPI0022E253B4|nr:hypothetical protein [Bacillus cereus group sp. BcHK140]MDA1919821.1 hypothetical protein [Bacillus cereus group sp. BcHK140]
MEIQKLNSDFYQIFQREIVLVEEDSNVNYQLKVRLKSTSKRGIYIDLPKFKSAAKYLQSNTAIANPPKDCDAIIIDLDSKIIYLIEMKRTSGAATNKHINQQLSAGSCWWKHMSFCMDNSITYTEKRIAVMVEERRSRVRMKKGEDLQLVAEYGFYKRIGNFLSLEYID